jgi:hypothetical protein
MEWTSEEALRTWLAEQQLPVDEYGRGIAKTVGHLFNEIIAGECQIELVDGRVERTIPGAHLLVRYQPADGKLLLLVEDRQIFSDGRVRRRQLTSSIGEKMHSGETPDQAAIRAFKEELGIADPTDISLDYQGLEEKVVASTSYPGIVSHYRTHFYHCLLPERHFNPNGYVEHQVDKSSYWVWREDRSDSETR